MKSKKRICLISLFFLSSSCLLNAQKPNNSSLVEVIEQASTSDSVEKKPTRRSTNRGSRGNRCENDDRCFDICSDLYDNDGSVEECGELRSSIVEEMEDFIDALGDDDITVKELERFDEDVFEEMLFISAYPWVHTIRRRVSRSSHAQTILAWIASNSNIWAMVKKYDGRADFSTDYRAWEGFANLLNKAADNNGGEQNDAFSDPQPYETLPEDSTCIRYQVALGIRYDPENAGNTIIGAGKTFLEILSSTTSSLHTSCSEMPKDLSNHKTGTCGKVGNYCKPHTSWVEQLP